MQEWIEQATADGHSARISAGFCWSWPRNRRATATLPLDIQIDVPSPTGGTRIWEAAWNARETLTDSDGNPLAPRSQLWATHTGGHQQIGCVYTAQGLEYHHSGVIIGPDLTWNNDHWEAHPDRSHDKDLRDLPPEQYLRYAVNIYRVLLTRGTYTTRIHTPPTPKPSTSPTSSSTRHRSADPPDAKKAPDKGPALLREQGRPVTRYRLSELAGDWSRATSGVVPVSASRSRMPCHNLSAVAESRVTVSVQPS